MTAVEGNVVPRAQRVFLFALFYCSTVRLLHCSNFGPPGPRIEAEEQLSSRAAVERRHFSTAPLLSCSTALIFAFGENWRRGELNPRPEITRMAASTCLVGVLISALPANADILRRSPVVCFSPADQRPNRQASPHFASDASRATHRDEVALFRQPYEPGRQSQPGLQHHCWQLMFARCLTRPTSVLGMPPPSQPSGRNRSPPVVVNIHIVRFL